MVVQKEPKVIFFKNPARLCLPLFLRPSSAKHSRRSVQFFRSSIRFKSLTSELLRYSQRKNQRVGTDPSIIRRPNNIYTVNYRSINPSSCSSEVAIKSRSASSSFLGFYGAYKKCFLLPPGGRELFSLSSLLLFFSFAASRLR